MNNDYKKITFDINGSFSLQNELFLNNIFSKFKENEISYSIEKNKFILYLHSLDFESFKSTINNYKNLIISE